MFKDVSLTFILISLASILGYAARILFARTLTLADYGLFYALIGFFALFAMFRSLGMTESLVHFIPKYTNEKNKSKIVFSVRFVLIAQLIISLIATMLFFIFAKPISVYFIHSESAIPLIKIQAVTFFTIGFIEVLVSIFRGFQKPIFASLYDPVRMTFVMIMSLFLIKFSLFNVKNLLYVWLIGYVLLAIFYLVALFKQHRQLFSIKVKKYDSVIQDIKSYSIPLMFGIGAQLIFSRIDEVILMFFKGSAQVALYEIAYPASQLMLLLISPFLFIIFPMVSKLFFENKKNSIKELLQMTYNTGLFLIAPLIILLVFYPDLIIRVLFSTKYLGAVTALQIMTFGTFFLIFSNINLSILSGMGKIKERTKLLYVVTAFNVASNLILVPYLGVIGAVIATSASFFLLWIISYASFAKDLPGFKLNLKYVGRIMFCSALFIATVALLKKILIMNLYLEAAIITIIGLALYFMVGIFMLKIINLGLLKKMYGEIRK